jgi:hypothetical protein
MSDHPLRVPNGAARRHPTAGSREGYRRIARFGSYLGSGLSVCYGRRLFTVSSQSE